MFPTAPLPERIGPYRVLRRLPSAGSADVYLGREEGPLGFQREVVLKLTPAGDAELADELAREAAAVSKLNHPAISRLFGFFQEAERLVLVLERNDGTTLARLLAAMRRRKQRLPDRVVFHVAHRLVSALAHAHAMTTDLGERTPVIHRAISPDVINVAWDGSVRLAGFGQSKIVGRSPDTAIGLVRGTPGYMAPEQLRGERATERVDVYQAGLIIWEMMAGEPPPTAQLPKKTREAELVQMLSGEKPASIAMIRPGLPREIVAVLDASLEPSSDRRTITCAEIERWLAKTVDVETGREELRQRLVSLRGSSRGSVVSDAARGTATPQRTRRGVERFPGHAVRVTGRRSEDKDAPTVPPPAQPSSSRRSVFPAPRSTRPPPPSGQSGPSTVRPAAGTPPPPPHVPPPLRPPPAPPAPSGDVSPVALMPAAASEERFLDTLVMHRRRPFPPRVLVGAAIGGGLLLLSMVVVVIVLVARRSPEEVATIEPGPPIAWPSPEPEPEPPPPPPAASTTPLPESTPGYISFVVRGVEGTVYVNGHAMADNDQPIRVPCGRRSMQRVFVRVGTPPDPGKQTLWLSKGVSLALGCGESAEVRAIARVGNR